MARSTVPGELLKCLDDAIAEKILIANGHFSQPFTTEENKPLYDPVESLCKLDSSYAAWLYLKYMNTLEERISKKVLPALEDKHSTTLLTEVSEQWCQYVPFAQSVAKIFAYLNNHYIREVSLPSISDVWKIFFDSLVLAEIYKELREEILCLIGDEREGKQIDHNLLGSYLYFILQMRWKGVTDYYEKIELAMLAEAALYYSQLSLEWWSCCDSFTNYQEKADECLVQERGRAKIYTRRNTKTKLDEVMKYILFQRSAKELTQKPMPQDLTAENQELLSRYFSLSPYKGSATAENQFKMARPAELGEMFKCIDDAMVKKNQIADGHSTQPFTTQDNMILYHCVYSLCTSGKNFPAQLYEKYKNTLKARIGKKVLPALEDKCGTALLTEVLEQWFQYMAFANSVSKIFKYLDDHYICKESLPSLSDTGKICFTDLVLAKLYEKLLEGIMCLIGEEREGELIDCNLLKSSIYFFLDVGVKGITDYYEKFELAMLAEAAVYYSQMSLKWRSCGDSFTNYWEKVDRCLVQEGGRAEIYPKKTTKTKLDEVMKYVLLERNAKKWTQGLTPEALAAEDIRNRYPNIPAVRELQVMLSPIDLN